MPLGERGLRRYPHSVVFALANAAYCLPVLLAFGFDFREGGVENALDVSGGEISRFLLVYLLSVVFFHCGAWFLGRFPATFDTRRRVLGPYADGLDDRPLKMLTGITCVALVGTKILLVPQGVYGGYVFDNDTPIGAMWSASMFLSESLVVLLFALLIRHRTLLAPWFLVGLACLCLNLLHGTRIFVTATALGVCVYFWITREITFRFFLRILAGLAVAVGILYLTFAARASYQYSADATGLTVALSPVVYEAVFSQMSLIGYLANYSVSWVGYPLGFLADAISFTLPRFLNPDKDSGGVLAPYAYLNPLGAFSGHAAGLIYFGYSMFFFYFGLGAFGSWLQRHARRRPAFFVAYLYFTGDILFRLMRDGYILPFKFFVDGLVIVIVAAWILPGLRGIGRFRQVPGNLLQPAGSP